MPRSTWSHACRDIVPNAVLGCLLRLKDEVTAVQMRALCATLNFLCDSLRHDIAVVLHEVLQQVQLALLKLPDVSFAVSYLLRLHVWEDFDQLINVVSYAAD
jgi:hypothetical protein